MLFIHYYLVQHFQVLLTDKRIWTIIILPDNNDPGGTFNRDLAFPRFAEEKID